MGFFDVLPIFVPAHRRPAAEHPDFVRTPARRQARREKNMAGSYDHVVDKKGNLLDNEAFIGMVENLGDAYETVEEMFGMIWWLACMAQDAPPMSAADLVESARQQYAIGLELAKQQTRKGDPDKNWLLSIHHGQIAETTEGLDMRAELLDALSELNKVLADMRKRESGPKVQFNSFLVAKAHVLHAIAMYDAQP